MAALVSILLAPAPIVMGSSAALVATGVFSDGSQQDITSQVVWNVISQVPDPTVTGITLVTIDSSGVVSTPTASVAVNGGSALISASLSEITGEATLTITPLVITALAFQSNPMSFPFTQILPQALVLATFNDGTQSVVNNNTLFPLSYVSSDTTVITFIDTRGTMHFLKSGSATLTVSLGNLSATTLLTISPLALNVTISGPSRGFVGQQVQLALFARFNDGTTSDVTAQALWSVTGQLVTISQQGLISVTGTGTTVVAASFGGVSTTFSFTVPSLLSNEIIVPDPSTVGQTVQFILAQHYSDGSTVDATNKTSWFCSTPGLGSIDATGKFTGIAPGIATVGEFLTGQAVQSVQYTVLPTQILSLVITSPSTSVAENSTVQLSAIATYTDGTTQDITSQVTWRAANPAAGISVAGLATGQTAGLAVIIANFQSIQASITINVFPAQDSSVAPQFRSHLTQEMLNYFDQGDVRVREQKYTIDAQLLNVFAQQLELSDTRFNRELGSTRLVHCPVNIDNKGVYFQQPLGSSFDYTVDHQVQAQLAAGGVLTPLTAYDDILPIPTRVEPDNRFSPVSIENPSLFSVSGIGLLQSQSWATQRVSNIVPTISGKVLFQLTAEGFNQIKVRIRITGQRAPQPAWASRRLVTSETLSMTSVGQLSSKFAWSVIDEIQITNLPVGATLSGQVGTLGLPRVLDSARPYTDSSNRDSQFPRYWTYDNGLLKEEYLASNYQGFRYVQSYSTAPINGIAVEPNTYGLFIAQGTTLLYMDRREPMPLSLSATALTVEPYYGLDVSIDETRTGPLRYVVLRPVEYAGFSNTSQYRYVIKTPQGSTYVLTPDGIMATFTTTAGWRRGTPISLTIPLAQIGTYVITLQCVGPNNTILADSVPYPNLALTPKAQFDLSGIVPSISGLSFDDRGRLWVWSGEFALPLLFHYDAYVLDEDTQSIYLTDLVQGLVIDGTAV